VKTLITRLRPTGGQFPILVPNIFASTSGTLDSRRQFTVTANRRCVAMGLNYTVVYIVTRQEMLVVRCWTHWVLRAEEPTAQPSNWIR